MIHTTETYVLDVLDESGRLVRSVELDEDAFMPCYEDTLFAGICAGQLPNTDRFPTATVEPWRTSPHSPYLTGVTMRIPPVTRSYGLSAFADVASAQDRPPRESPDAPEIHVDQAVSWRLRGTPRTTARAGRSRAVVRRHPYPIRHEALDAMGVPHVTVAPPPFALHISQLVLSELREATVGSLHIERADILTGRLVQDPDGSIAVVVTGRTAATVEAAGTAATFRFSPVTFAAARTEILSRDPQATIVGWAHNHPVCQDCPVAEPYCQSDTVFFSRADRQVHRTSFAAPYTVALVLGKGRHKSPTEPIVRAYAWNHGTIHEHPMHVY